MGLPPRPGAAPFVAALPRHEHAVCAEVSDSVGSHVASRHSLDKPELRRKQIMKDELILVAGGGGFIGGHLVADLRRQGYWRIRSVDVKPLEEWYQVHDECDNVVADLKDLDACHSACEGATTVYNLAADMGGMGFIENNKALC